MTLLEAHGLLARWYDVQREQTLPGDFEVQTPNGAADVWPAAATAAAILAGTLATVETEEDLREAIAHFRALLSIGVRTEDEWRAETEEVLAGGPNWRRRRGTDTPAIHVVGPRARGDRAGTGCLCSLLSLRCLCTVPI